MDVAAETMTAMAGAIAADARTGTETAAARPADVLQMGIPPAGTVRKEEGRATADVPARI